VWGAIGRDGLATRFAAPGENRIAALLALGIWPFAPEGYNISDVPDVPGAAGAAGAAGELARPRR